MEKIYHIAKIRIDDLEKSLEKLNAELLVTKHVSEVKDAIALTKSTLRTNQEIVEKLERKKQRFLH